MVKNKISETVAKLVDLLEDFEPKEIATIIKATTTILGGDGDFAVDHVSPTTHTNTRLHARASTWVRQNGISMEQLEQVFHIDDGATEVIAHSLPGQNLKAKTINAYLLEGVRAFLGAGDPAFDDKAARELCKDLGCYNEANHATYMNGRGNEFTGSKNLGWKLTAPGLKKAAELIKEIASA